VHCEVLQQHACNIPQPFRAILTPRIPRSRIEAAVVAGENVIVELYHAEPAANSLQTLIAIHEKGVAFRSRCVNHFEQQMGLGGTTEV
jgi:hypothetical protein